MHRVAASRPECPRRRLAVRTERQALRVDPMTLVKPATAALVLGQVVLGPLVFAAPLGTAVLVWVVFAEGVDAAVMPLAVVLCRKRQLASPLVPEMQKCLPVNRDRYRPRRSVG